MFSASGRHKRLLLRLHPLRLSLIISTATTNPAIVLLPISVLCRRTKSSTGHHRRARPLNEPAQLHISSCPVMKGFQVCWRAALVKSTRLRISSEGLFIIMRVRRLATGNAEFLKQRLNLQGD